MNTVHIALGSNLGDRRAAMSAAVAAIAALPDTTIDVLSSVIETEPVGPPGQGAYLNAVARIKTGLSPGVLLAGLLEIERALGRVRSPKERWGPRTIDLDILLWGDRVIDEPSLTIPHPRLHERRFVLLPLAEIDADVVVPTRGLTAARLLAELEA